MILQLKYHPNGIADEPHTIFDPKGSGQASHGMRNKKARLGILVMVVFPLAAFGPNSGREPYSANTQATRYTGSPTTSNQLPFNPTMLPIIEYTFAYSFKICVFQCNLILSFKICACPLTTWLSALARITAVIVVVVVHYNPLITPSIKH